ncbi:MAG: shikimate kinase [Candidatus Saganbacteria bacterium]|nr:shikimate kinase [Candidatus Saganbacteria bacterium]
MNIILIGFMGSGKSEIGRRLASRLSMSFLDTDTLIEKTENSKISEIFEKKGEEYFRDLETKVIKTLGDYEKFVFATGGGMILRSENVKMLKELGPLILLWAGPEIIFERLRHSKNRPLIQGEKENKIRKILEERTPIYNQAADFKIDTSKLSINQAVEEIVEWIEK